MHRIPNPGRCLRNSGHRERRIQQHIHSSHLHDAIFGPRRFAGHRTMPAEHPGPTGWGKPTYAGRITPLSADCLAGSVVIMNIRRWIAIGLAAVAAASATATTATAAAAAAATPAQHAYRQQDLQRDLDAITATGVPGVLAEVRTGGRELRGTSGVADLDSRKPVDGNGFFRVGSNTKTFISVVLLQLVAERRLSLDDTVGHWLPGVVHGHGNDGGKITVRELLQHTSGLHNYTDDLQAQITSPEAYRKLEFHQFSRQDLLNIALAHRPDSAPGTAWNYSNTNYILLGMIIECQRPRLPVRAGHLLHPA